MNWWEWVFSGIGVLGVTLLIEWFRRRSLPTNPSAAIKAQGAKVTDSPVASGSGIRQAVNSPNVIVNVNHPTAQVPSQPRVQANPSSPNIVRTAIRDANLARTDSDEWHPIHHDDADVVKAVVIRFVNEANPNGESAEPHVTATLIYRNEMNEERERITGCWLRNAFCMEEFHVNSAHDLIALATVESQTFGLENPRRSNARYSEDETRPVHIDFTSGTLEVQLNDHDTGQRLYGERFAITASPFAIVPVESPSMVASRSGTVQTPAQATLPAIPPKVRTSQVVATATRVIRVNQTGRTEWSDRGPYFTQDAIVIEFTNEAGTGFRNSQPVVRASLVYSDEENEILRITGGWVNQETDLAGFKVEQSHKLIVGVLLGDQLFAVEQTRTLVSVGSETCDMTHRPLRGFRQGKVRVRLTDIHSQTLLYEAYFDISLNPLRIVPG